MYYVVHSVTHGVQAKCRWRGTLYTTAAPCDQFKNLKWLHVRVCPWMMRLLLKLGTSISWNCMSISTLYKLSAQIEEF